MREDDYSSNEARAVDNALGFAHLQLIRVCDFLASRPVLDRFIVFDTLLSCDEVLCTKLLVISGEQSSDPNHRHEGRKRIQNAHERSGVHN